MHHHHAWRGWQHSGVTDRGDQRPNMSPWSWSWRGNGVVRELAISSTAACGATALTNPIDVIKVSIVSVRRSIVDHDRRRRSMDGLKLDFLSR